MALNMFEIRRLAKRGNVPVEVAQPLVQGWVTRADVADVGLEVLDVDGVEADDGGVEADVGFCDGLAVVVLGARGVLAAEVGFGAVEGGEERVEGLLVGGLRGGEAGLVDAVVDVVVGPVVGGFDVLLQILGEEVDFGVFFGQ